MQIRCAHCTKTLALGQDGALPGACPHCTQRPGPEALGPYEPLRLLATGGMGEVYLARHRELGTEVAIKLLPALPHEQLAAVRERFVREARLTAEVKHPGVVQVLASDVTGDRPYLVLELVRGQTLRQRLLQGALPVAEAARIAAATADVLAAAHAQGVFHRDIKPDNVMLEPDGTVRVLDFGIARAVQDDAPITRTGEIVGTPEYMAPEQLLDGPDAIDARTDVHALGVLAYELLTGRSPFHGANVFQALKLVEALLPPPPSSLRGEVPTALDRAVLRALEKQPDDRFATAAAFAGAIRGALPEPSSTTTGKRTSPWLWFFCMPLAMAALLGIGVVFFMTAHLDELDEATKAALAKAMADVTEDLRGIEQAHQALTTGRWCDALAQAEHANGTRFAEPELAQWAFVQHHLAWPLAAGLPAWIARSEERQRTRLFGDALEPTPTTDAELLAMRSLLALDPAATSTADAPLRWLQLGLADDPELARQLAAAADDEPLARLLRLRLLPHAQRADGFADYAQRLPIDCAEHWLARTIERHLRGDAKGGTLAAENAWLAGAGELAVLLDAAMQLLDTTTAGAPLRPIARGPATSLLRRLAAGAADDAPAGALLQVLLVMSQGAEPELALARPFPRVAAPFAQRWFVTSATANPTHATSLLLVAASLGAKPDYTGSPWSQVPPELRAQLDAESARGR